MTAPDPLCPRCGYDLGGTMAAWTERCPLGGRCTECGLEFQWADVLHMAVHPWLLEYHWRRGPVRRFVTTWRRALRPARFWSEVRMVHPIYLRPALLVGLVALAAALAAVHVKTIYQINAWSGWTGRGPAEWLDQVLYVARHMPAILFRDASGVLITLLAMPLAFLLMPVTLRRAKVRPAHVLRIWTYSLVFPATLTMAWIVLYIALDMLDWDLASRVVNPWLWLARRSGVYLVVLLRSLLPSMALWLVALAWVVPWWWFACRDYLRLPQAGLTVLLLGTTVGLLGCVVQLWQAVG